MEISARSYLTAGLALTAASAIAITPVVMPTNDRTVTLPSVSVPDLQLTAAIDPAAIEAFIETLETALGDVVATIDTIAGIPGQTLIGALEQAETLNATLWNTLIEAASVSPVLQGVLTAVGNTSEAGFASLVNTVSEADLLISLLPGSVADIIGSTLIGSLSSALFAVTDVINNPLAVSSYTGLLSGAVDIAAEAAYGGIDLVNEFGATLLGFSAGELVVPGLLNVGIGGANQQIQIALSGLSGLLSGIATAADNDIITGVVAAIQGLAIAPISAVTGVAAGAATSVVGAASDAFFTVTDGAFEAVAVVQEALNGALNAIGDKPLDLASYTTALSSVISGGFGVFNTAVYTAGDLLQVPLGLASSLTTQATQLVTSLTEGLGTAVSGLLTAIGLPEEVASLPVTLVATLNQAIVTAADLVQDGISAASGLIDAGVGTVIEVSNAIEDTITGALDTVGEALPDLTPAPPAPPVDNGGEQGLVAARVLVTEAPAAELTEATPAKDADLTDTVVTAPELDSDSDKGESSAAPSKRELAKEKREAAKADREAAKAERSEKRAAAKAERAEKREAAKAERAAKRSAASAGSDSGE